MKFNLAYIGFGTVGQGLTEILVNNKNIPGVFPRSDLGGV